MICKTHNVKINLPGGIMSVEIFQLVLEAAEKARIEEVKFGTRQQMYLEVQENFLKSFTHKKGLPRCYLK